MNMHMHMHMHMHIHAHTCINIFMHSTKQKKGFIAFSFAACIANMPLFHNLFEIFTMLKIYNSL